MAGCAGDRLRRQRRAPGLPRHGLDRHRRAATAAGGVRPVGVRAGRSAWSSSTATAATSRRWPRRSALLRYEGRDVGWCSVRVRRRRRPRRPHRNFCIATYFAGRRAGSTSGSPGNSAPLAELLPAMRRGGVAAVSRGRRAGRPDHRHRRRGRARIFAEMVDGCVAPDRRWAPGPRRDADMSQPRLPDGFAVQVDRRVQGARRGLGAARRFADPAAAAGARRADHAQRRPARGARRASAPSSPARCWTPRWRIRGPPAARRTAT